MANVPDETIHAVRTAWEESLQRAKSLMTERSGTPRVLIEVAAQHPLVGGVHPNEEFEARLNRGYELYTQFLESGQEVELYVPGSRHMFHGHPDKISLSAAGTTYLVARGIPAAHVHGDDLNHRYKGDDGVYNSADECFVAASHFKDANFGTLVSVLSPGQLHRKMLHYIHFGVLPLAYTAPTVSAFHDYVHEALVELPHVLYDDPGLQAPDSAKANRLRARRRPPAD
ncbi:hypothetical protein [Streptomyces herbicida]|uniref:hypothetical protein n=1 Tax=Streptomyces herbicida TaxID=3065675 RepID=UPI00292E76EA|nr:hypothetical protein [Streptomyces sp. NEAU-HV9]